MKLRNYVLLIVISACLLTLAACGSGADSETNGNISLALVATDTTTGTYTVQATATFSQAVPNFPIRFSYRLISASDPTGSLAGNSGSTEVATNNLGISMATFNVVQTAENVFLQVEAKSGNVSSGTQGVTIPAL